MRVLVVDDEAPARRRLVRQLEELGGVEIAGEAANGLEALDRIADCRPDAVFLDVRMPELDGLTLASRYSELPPIVFTTAYDEFAVRAFEVNAVDYLLKPVRRERLAAAVGRLRRRAGPPTGDVARALEAVAPSQPTAVPRVVAAHGGVVRLFDARTVTRFWSDAKYTVFRADGAEHLTEEPLGVLEERLSPFGFVRVHRAELVNLAEVRALETVDGAHVLHLSDGQTARVSRRMLAAINAALGVRRPRASSP